MIVLLVYCIINLLGPVAGLGTVIYAINAGGDSHIDAYGIRYERDPLHNKIGTSSDFGRQLIIRRVSPGDQILYQTERYHYSSFGYDIPISSDGEYIIVLKFCEVYFSAPEQKVFDVILNHEITVISSLDIFSRVGRGVAHDEYVRFTVEDKVIEVNGHKTKISGNSLRVEFVKGRKDNPKINAIYVVKGRIEDVPKLPRIALEEEPEVILDNPEQEQAHSSKRRPSGPKTSDPYEEDQTSALLPVFIAIGAALPLLFCLCRL